MRLSVLTPECILVDAEVSEVSAPGSVGELGVLADHITFLGTLGTGEIRYRGAGGDGRLIMSGGLVEVADNQITIIADRALAPDDVDAEAARRELAEAEAALATGDPYGEAHERAENARQWATLRLSMAGGARSV